MEMKVAWKLSGWLTDLQRSYADSMDLQVPSEIAAKLVRLAEQTGRTADQVALDLLRDSVEHNEWFRSEVEKDRVSARDETLLDHQEVVTRINTRYRS
jgi:predicted transcriptional regulator